MADGESESVVAGVNVSKMEFPKVGIVRAEDVGAKHSGARDFVCQHTQSPECFAPTNRGYAETPKFHECVFTPPDIVIRSQRNVWSRSYSSAACRRRRSS